MDEARLQVYINLIEQLLTCADGEELNILQANQELIDSEFLRVMENYATGLKEQGYNNPAAGLRNMAQQLAEALELLRDETLRIPTETSNYPSLARKNQTTLKNKNIHFISLIGKLFYKLARSFIILLFVVFIEIPSLLLKPIFPVFKRKMEF